MISNYKNELAELRVFDHVGSMATHLPRSRRLGLWQIDGGPQCSIIGTCLSHQDLRAAICKHRLSLDANASSYDVHNLPTRERRPYYWSEQPHTLRPSRNLTVGSHL